MFNPASEHGAECFELETSWVETIWGVSECKDGVVQGSQHLWGLPSTNGAGVFAQCGVAAPVEAILDFPVPADVV